MKNLLRSRKNFYHNVLYRTNDLCQGAEQIRNKREGTHAMQRDINDFLKINQGDDEDLIKIKQVTQKAIDDGDFENLSFIQLISANGVVEQLKSNLDFDKDIEKIKLLSDFLHSVYQSYRDSIVFATIESVVELVESSTDREVVVNTLYQGLEIIRDKMLKTNDKEKLFTKRMEQVFPELAQG
jgi:hypothetical protein